jgi:hypothetical protein
MSRSTLLLLAAVVTCLGVSSAFGFGPPPNVDVTLEMTLGPIGEHAEAVDAWGDAFIVGGADYEALIYQRVGGIWQQQASLTPWDQNGRIFGYSVSLAADVAVVSNPWDSQENGAAYVYHRQGNSWVPGIKLKLPSDTDNAWFGTQVATDGQWIVSGAPRSRDWQREVLGSAYIYRREDDVWMQQAVLQSPDMTAGDYFGSAVDISGDRMIIGAQGQADKGAAYIYQLINNQWSFEAKLICPDNLAVSTFGQKLAIDGNTALVANPSNKTAYVFEFDGTEWAYETSLTPSTDDGGNLHRTLDVDGDLIAIGDPFSGANVNSEGLVSLYHRNSLGWTLAKTMQPPVSPDRNRFGLSVSVEDETLVVTGYGHQGRAFVYNVTVPEPRSSGLAVFAMLGGLSIGRNPCRRCFALAPRLVRQPGRLPQ